VRKLFTEHPAAVGETYAQHMRSALGFAGAMFAASLACFIHAILPWTFKTTGSSAILRLHERMVEQRARGRRPASGVAGQVAASGD